MNTEIDVDAMEAGRELDVLIAERVMGKKVVDIEGESYALPPEIETAYPVKAYSTDIEAAWQIVEYMKSQHDMVFALMNRHEGRGAIKDWRADFYPFISDRNRSGYAYGETAPEAICRAALKALTHTP